MNHDHLAIAVDWFDAYRARDVDAILDMYADDAECRCDNVKENLRAYWTRQLQDFPASELDDLQPNSDGATISYVSGDGIVAATLAFDPNGRIASVRCDLAR